MFTFNALFKNLLGIESSEVEEKKSETTEIPEIQTDPSHTTLLTKPGPSDHFSPTLKLKVGRSPNPNAQDHVLIKSIVELAETKEGKESTKTPPSILFILDRSGSMWPTRHIHMKAGLLEIFEKQLSADMNVQIIIFDNDASILWQGSPKAQGIDKIINGIPQGGTTSFSAPFNLIDPDFFGDGQNLICFLTDGESNEGIKDPSIIMNATKEKFVRKNKHFPTVLAIAVGQGAKVSETQKFDYPITRGLYAQEGHEIALRFAEVSEVIGKILLPVEITYHTVFGKHVKKLGSIQSDQKLLGATHLSKGELELLSSLNCQLKLGTKQFDFKWTLPSLKELSHDPEMIALYYISYLTVEKELTVGEARILKHKIRTTQKYVAWLKEIDPDFDTHYAQLSSFVNAMYDQYILEKTDNITTSTRSNYSYSINSGRAYSQKLTNIKRESKESAKIEYKPEYEGLSLDIFNEDIVKLIEDEDRVTWALKLKNKVAVIHLDTTDTLLVEHAEKINIDNSDMIKLIDYVNKIFTTEIELSDDESLANYVAEGKGNTLLKAMLCAYFLAVNIHKGNLTKGTVKIFHGIDESLQKIHFWCIYQTKKNIVLFDPTNNYEYNLVNFKKEVRRENLIQYYKEERQLPGILRDTINIFKYTYPESDIISLPVNILKLTKTKPIIPEELLCPVSRDIIKTPVRLEKTNLIFDKDSDLTCLKEIKLLGNYLPATEKLRTLKQFITQSLYNQENMHYGFSIIPLAETKKLSFNPIEVAYPPLELTEEEIKQSLTTLSTLSLPSTSTSRPISSFRLFSKDKLPSSSFYLCHTPAGKLEMIFPDEKAKMTFLKEPLGKDNIISEQKAFGASIFITLKYSNNNSASIQFDSKENLQSFIQLFGVKGESVKNTYYPRMDYHIGIEPQKQNSKTYYFESAPTILYFESDHPVFGVPTKDNNVTTKDYYLEVIDKRTEIISRKDYLMQSKSTQRAYGFS
jgi:hypothetical protein